ncbi:linoleate diol synthase [Colletotrichum karsti]|uniref:linoleate 8R-lipoxygenase n=1 Tax=Colletotrichum karsti TaxID=1095194 RepID=A0A9P6I202_9PEZI|nr:linoleate diol synthase [Colletotrichum karsti]KAF9874998.1 linoleate diol synthase [Colletotrichum karsti]
MSFNTKYQAGEAYGDERKGSNNFFADPKKVAADIIKDLGGVHGTLTPTELINLVQQLTQKGEPLDDKKLTTEALIGVLTALPSGSNTRNQLTNKLIDTLWGNLQHPPLSYVGGDVKYEVVKSEEQIAKEKEEAEKAGKEKPADEDAITFQSPDFPEITLREHLPLPPDGLHHYRMPDGSFNNILEPNLGRAGTPYAKTVRTEKRLQAVKPDAGLLFDLLMARDEQKFTENPAGISSMLFYHASIIIHDIFRTNRTDMNKSDTSSYLDLAPLYGSSFKDQLEIRTMKEGKLKPDTFHEKRLLGQPAGVNVMLVLYNRFHNYVCDILLKINENKRFSVKCPADAAPEEQAQALAKQDHDLFNTARLIVGGLYINICLHDYLRAITNTHHSKSDWTLDPRVEIGKQFDGEGVPRGVGNQVSVEFNLLYRFHSCISKKDERWINGFFAKLFPGRKPEDLDKVPVQDLMAALQKFEQEKIPKDPSKRTFDDLVRQDDGTFKDEDLVRVLKEAMDDPAGTFGARMVPKALKVVEVMGITQARRWQVASLNEFRDFFGLKRHNTFKDINSNEEIANLLEKLYTDPDMVELYPGLMIEDIKPVRNTGSGICPTYTVGRAVLSDAVTLVRSDRFNTLDYTVSNLTAWGFNEVQQDPKTLGGSMLYKLIQRGLPGWFPFNSIAVMQPMYTKQANERIARQLGTFNQFTLDDPKPPAKYVVVRSTGGIKHVLGNHDKYAVPWLPPLQALFTGQKKDISWFMLAGDAQTNKQEKINMQAVMKKVPGLHNAVHEFIERVGKRLIDKETFKMREGLFQMDIIRDVAIPLNAQLLSDLFYMDMNSDENPNGTIGAADLYRHLLNVRIWGANNSDPAQAWNRRRRAQEGVKIIIESTKKLVNEVSMGRGFGLGVVSALNNVVSRKTYLKKDSLRSCGYKLVEEQLNQGGSVDKVTDNLWLTAFGGIGVPVTTFYEVLDFFLRPENASIWSEVQNLAAKNDEAGLHAYVNEAMRLTSTQRTLRVSKVEDEVDGQKIQPGNVVVTLLGLAGRNPEEVQDADKFDAKRNTEGRLKAFGTGQHECLGQDVARAFVTGLVKLVAGLKELRPAPGDMGVVKTIQVRGEKAYLNDSWSYLGFDASTWKVHFNGHGQGGYKGGSEESNKQIDLGQYYYVLQKRKENFLKGVTGSS